MALEWELLNETGEWIECSVEPETLPSAAIYTKAVLLNNNEVILKLISSKDSFTGACFWAVGKFND